MFQTAERQTAELCVCEIKSINETNLWGWLTASKRNIWIRAIQVHNDGHTNAVWLYTVTFCFFLCNQEGDIQYSEDTSKDEDHSADRERKNLRGVTCAPKGAPMANEGDDCPYYSAGLNICEEQFPSLTLDSGRQNSRYGTNPRTNVSAKANKE